MADNDMMIALHEAVENALEKVASEKTKELTKIFERYMENQKGEIITRIVNQIQMEMNYNQVRGEYVIQFRLGGGKNG